MGANTTLHGDIGLTDAAYVSAELLERGQNTAILERFGQSKPLPKNHGGTIEFIRFEALLAATAPLAEATPPAGQKLTKTVYRATLEQYGDKVELSDVIYDLHHSPVFSDTIDNCADQIVDTIELLRWNVVKSGTNVYYAGGVATSRETVNSPITNTDLRLVTRGFYRNKAKVISKIVKASALVSTQPVAPAFFAVAHTDLKDDFRALTGWLDYEEYSNSDKAILGEIGKVGDVRVVLSNLFEPWEAAATSATGTTFLSGGEIVTADASPDVYPVVIFARNAYGIVPLQGENAVKPMVYYPGKPTPYDPLGQIGFVSWKTYQASVILNQFWMARIECACTARP